ncbi:DUF3857 domain-containing transglutaminase family protein [Lysobacter sp. LF1]|uniref:DUF3857 domain-containing transglutaminase family protein n=1 Tax=Lysobacter stagni TaxID=3045172 RepID=A0ABT6XBI5_9GAMM|nr:DUF3857 domain-containing transglutaminase family protein [Lysobacter sp. LF1]MDI9237467.1 DUF3857 domain-containing transglutaminase family protein [Lysobacter sp. LF1]
MRVWWGLLALALAGGAWAADTQHVRGEYRFSVGGEPAFVERTEIAAQWDPAAPGASDAPWRFWLYDLQIDNRRGQDAYYVDYVFEPKSATLLGEAGRYQISFNPEYQQLKIHRVELRRGGRWLSRLAPERISLARRETDFEQDLADGQVTALIVLDDVRVDDVVRVSYTITGTNPVLAGNTATAMPMGWRSPTLDMRFRSIFDAGTDVAVHSEGKAPQPQVRSFADRVEATARVHAVPAYVDESDYPRWYRSYPHVQAAARRSWADVVAWALPLYPKVDALPPDLEAQIARWHKLGSDEQRLKAALRAVQEQVRYFGVEMGDNTHRPTPPAETWTRRYGDCKDKAYLLSTVLARMGIRAEPALVSADRGQAVAQYLPAASLFDHVIVRASVDNATVWVDPTLTSEGGNPSESDQSAYGHALPIAAGITALQPIARPRNAHNSVTVEELYRPAADGRAALLEVRTLYEGDSANYSRRMMARERLEDVARRYADFYRQRFGEVEVQQPPRVQDDLDSNRLTMLESYRLLAPFESEGGGRALEVMAESLSRATSLPTTVERTGPLYLGEPKQYSHRIQVALPPQWRPVFGNEDERFASPGFDYRRGVRVDGARVDVVYDMKVLQPELTAEQVSAHVQQMRKVRDSLSAKLRFQVPTQLQRDDREARLKALLRGVIDEGSTP